MRNRTRQPIASEKNRCFSTGLRPNQDEKSISFAQKCGLDYLKNLTKMQRVQEGLLRLVLDYNCSQLCLSKQWQTPVILQKHGRLFFAPIEPKCIFNCLFSFHLETFNDSVALFLYSSFFIESESNPLAINIALALEKRVSCQGLMFQRISAIGFNFKYIREPLNQIIRRQVHRFLKFQPQPLMEMIFARQLCKQMSLF